MRVTHLLLQQHLLPAWSVTVLLAAGTMYVTLVVAAALAAGRFLRGAAASERHLFWWTAVAAPALCTLVLGLVTPLLQPYRVAFPMEAPLVFPGSARANVAACVVWLAGLAASLLWIAGGAVALRLQSRRIPVTSCPRWRALSAGIAATLGIRRRIRLRVGGAAVPFTYGVVRPTVVLPAGAEQWSDSRREFVLLHELAHVARFDTVSRGLERLAGALFWFHPLVWVALRRGNAERERACDDLVVTATAQPAEYAGELLDLARERSAVPAAGLCLAPTDVELRIAAIFDRLRPRNPARTGQVAAAGLTVAAIVCAAFLFGAGPAAGLDLCASGVEPSLQRSGFRPHRLGVRLREFTRCSEVSVFGPDGGADTVVFQTVDLRRTCRMTISRGVRTFRVDGVQVDARQGTRWLDELLTLYDTTHAAADIRAAAAAAGARPAIPG